MKMNVEDTGDTRGFYVLFTEVNIPHIQEKIFFSLDYESFMECEKVNSAWRQLFSSDKYQRRAQELMMEKKKNEGKLLKLTRQGNFEGVRNLLSIGINPNTANEDGFTALHMAAYNGYRDMVQLLLDEGTNANNATDYGGTPLHGAALSGHKDVVLLLLDRGADPNKPNVNGFTPVHWAANKGHKDVVQHLLDKGADPNKGDEDGWTPRQWAAMKGHKDVVNLLNRNGKRRNVGSRRKKRHC